MKTSLRLIGPIGLLAAVSLCPCALGAQNLGVPTPYIMLDGTRGFGGYELMNRASSGWAIGVDFPVYRLAGGEVLLGAGMARKGPTGETILSCRTGVRRQCWDDFPEFESRYLDLGWRHPVPLIGKVDVLLQPTWFNTNNRSYFGPSATVALSRRLFGPVAIVVSGTGSYISSYEDQRLGLRRISTGLRVW